MTMKFVPALAALLLSACASTGGYSAPAPVIDASSEEQFNDSLKGMFQRLGDDERSRLTLAIYVIAVAQLRNEGKVDAEGRPLVAFRNYDIATRIAGKSFDQILAMAGT